MKKALTFVAILTFLSVNIILAETDSTRIQIEMIEKSLNYQTGTINFPTCKAKLAVPEGFRYLNKEQSMYVLTDLWGNPSDSTILGLLVPSNRGVLETSSWVFTINFEDIGYVKDDDAKDINYDKLLEQMQQEMQEANPEREKLGYQPIKLLGWASAPYYDKDKKVLHWAKDLRFGEDSSRTLNYNLRILGKDGVFVLNAVASMSELAEVKPQINKVLSSIEFEKGNTYFDFDPKVDKVAAWSIGGLIAGKVLAKVGFFAVIAKFSKVIIIALIGIGAALLKFFKGRKNEETGLERK